MWHSRAVRFVVIGAGAIGGAIGGRLAEHGHDVALVARGEHATTMQRDGLVVEAPDRTITVHPPVVADVGELRPSRGDVAVVAVKSQDAPPLLDALRRWAGDRLPIVCAQNGVDNERAALRLFSNVQGMNVMCPVTHLVPGVVRIASAPISGVLDVGRAPAGVDEVSDAVADALTRSGFDSRPDRDIMRWKRTKLLLNLGNALEAACGIAPDGEDDTAVADRAARLDLYLRARAEGLACFAAAGLSIVDADEERERRTNLTIRPVAGGSRRGGSSTWQSLTKGSRSSECDHLNGEIVLLGRLHGVPTPVNATLQRTLAEMVADGARPGRWTAAEIAARVSAPDPASWWP